MVKRVTFKLDKAKSPIRHSPRKTSGSGTTLAPLRAPPRRKVSTQEKQPIHDPNTSLIANFLDDFYSPETLPPPSITTEKVSPRTPVPSRYSEICAAISATISPRSLTNMDRAGRSARASRTRSTEISRTEMRLLANERASTDAGVPTYLRELLIRAKERRPFTHYTSLAHAIPISPDDRSQAAIDATVFFLATLPGKKADLFAVEDFIKIKCPNLRTTELHNALHDAKCIKFSEYCLSDSGHRLVPSQNGAPGNVILYTYDSKSDNSNSYRSIIYNWIRHEFRRLTQIEYSKESWIHSDTCHPVERPDSNH